LRIVERVEGGGGRWGRRVVGKKGAGDGMEMVEFRGAYDNRHCRVETTLGPSGLHTLLYKSKDEDPVATQKVTTRRPRYLKNKKAKDILPGDKIVEMRLFYSLLRGWNMTEPLTADFLELEVYL